jgi:Ras-related protein Rab-1A
MARVEYDYLCKVILIGDSGAGKTSVLCRFTDDVFTDSFVSTIGVDFKIKTLHLKDGKIMKLQVWDTSGHERFRTITQSYYRGAHFAVVVYDISSIESFRAVPDWMEGVTQHCSEPVQIMLLGNKSDLAHRREVLHSVAERFVEERQIPLFLEVSAKSGSNIDDAFAAMAEKYKPMLQHASWSSSSNSKTFNEVENSKRLLLPETPKKSTCC